MTRLPPSAWSRNLKEIVDLWNRHPEAATEAARRSPEDAIAERGFVLEVARCLTAGDAEAAGGVLREAWRRFRVPPVSLFTLQVDIRHALGEEDRLPSDYLDYGCRAIEAGRWDRGCEAVGTALVEDADRYLKMIYDRPSLLRATGHYEQAARHLASQAPALTPRRPRVPYAIGVMVANLVDDTVAYAKRVMDFARHLDPKKYAVHVYSTENMTLRAHELPVRCGAQPSDIWAPRYLAELRERGIPVYLATRNVPVTAAALRLAQRFAEAGLDALVMQSGPTMPIDWLAMRLAPVSAKLHIHIGAPNYMLGMDATIFDNAVNLEREREGWPDYAGELVLMRQGTDLDVLDAEPAARRADFGLPDAGVLIGVLSNHLDRRLSPDYLDVVAATLRRHAEAWFVPIGQRELPAAARHVLEVQGVADRVRHIPAQRRPGGVLKMLDIYANEFPVGGSQAVVEAMACRLPVVAMRWGATHVESAGADIVGPECALMDRDPATYAALLSRWIGEPRERRRIGDALRRRCEREYSIRDYVRQVAEQAEVYGAKKPCAES